MCGLALFAGMEAIAKELGRRYSPLEVSWARYAVHLALLSVLLIRMRPRQIVRTANLKLQILRSVLIVLLTVLFFAAVGLMTLADATTVLYAGPLLIVALSGPVLGERVGYHRWTGVIIGFIGVVLIVRPGGEGFGWGAAMAFGAALCYAGYSLITRIIGPTESPATTVFYTALVGVVPLSLIVPFVWRTPEGIDWLLLFATGAMGAIAHYLIVLAYARAAASALAPFAYSHLLWAALYGYLAFDETPDEWSAAGALIVTASGLYVWYRERRIAASQAVQTAERTPRGKRE